MFRKSILQLRLKDKLFFLLVTILAVGGIFVGVKTGISYLSGSIKGHKKEINDTKSQFSQLEATYGPQLKTTLEEIQKAARTLKSTAEEIKNTAKQFQNGLFAQINTVAPWQAVTVFAVIFWVCAKEEIGRLIRVFCS